MSLIRSETPYSHLVFEDPTSGDLLRLVPERGGLVTGWRCGGAEILYFDAERFADPRQSVRGGIPVLFPICGGLPDNRLPLPQGSFVLPQHGFARNCSWQIEELAAASGVRLHLADSAETRQHFPFAFALNLELRLEPGALAIAATVENRSSPSSGPMPFSLGLHPYFNISDLSAVQIEGLPPRCFNHLTMADDDTAGQLARLSQGIDLLVEPQQAVHLVDSGSGRRISLENPPPFDLAVLWSEPPRPMLCLEPWSGPRSALISGERRLELAAGAALTLHCRYRVS